MRLRDLESVVYDGLKGLPYPRYLLLMYGVCDEMRALYGDELKPGLRALVGRSLTLVGGLIEASRSGNGKVNKDGGLVLPALLAATAARLWSDWEPTMNQALEGDRRGFEGAVSTVHEVVGEVVGERPPYWGCEYVHAAFRFYEEPAEPPTSDDPAYPDYLRRFVWLNSPLEVDESEFYVRLFRAVEAGIELAASDPGFLDRPAGSIRDLVFGALR